METEELTIGRVHHGRNIRRTRIEKDMNQEGLSELVHLSQPAVSKYEKMKVIDDEMLQRFARALNVPFDYLKTLEEDAQTVVFENNTVNNSEQSAGGANISMGIVKSDTEDSINDSRVNNFNPIDKITELYERLLKEKDEKYAALERRLQVSSRGYMLGYNDLKDPSVSRFFRFLAKVGDRMMKMQIVKIRFGGKQ